MCLAPGLSWRPFPDTGKQTRRPHLRGETVENAGKGQRVVTRGVDRVPPLAIALPALAMLVVSAALMLWRVEPFVTWFYVFAWYPTLILLDALIALRTGHYTLLTRPRYAASLLFWSAALWYVFELINFRVQNWYYVFVPDDRLARWIGVTLSFMTVLPAIFLGERWLSARGVAERVRWRPLTIGRGSLFFLVGAGLLFVALTLAWPLYFFPLVWGALTLLLEPWNYWRDPDRSLLGDLERGRPDRLLRLVLAGLVIGFVWELYNIEARGKWIYTVPGLEGFKLFEMPVPGFLGFPVFALDCFVVYQSLVLSGVAVPWRDHRRIRPVRTAVACLTAMAFMVAVLLGMERWNIDSYTPRLADLWVLDDGEAERLRGLGYGDPFELARADPVTLARGMGIERGEAETRVAAARLVTHRGIGTRNARLLWEIGIRSIPELARADPNPTSAELRRRAGRSRAGAPARVGEWIRSARRVVGDREAGPDAGTVSPTRGTRSE